MSKKKSSKPAAVETVKETVEAVEPTTIILKKGSIEWDCRSDEADRIEHLINDGFVIVDG